MSYSEIKPRLSEIIDHFFKMSDENLFCCVMDHHQSFFSHRDHTQAPYYKLRFEHDGISLSIVLSADNREPPYDFRWSVSAFDGTYLIARGEPNLPLARLDLRLVTLQKTIEIINDKLGLRNVF